MRGKCTVSSDDPIMQTRLDVAEMKGMLTQIVSTHEARLLAHDVRLDTHDTRLNEKAKTLARHDEKISDTEEDVKQLQSDNTARLGRNLGVGGLIVAIIGIILNASKFLP